MSEEPHLRILSACYRLLLPIAKMLLNNGITYKEFDLACRQAFVHTASRQFGIRRRATNASRISAMTGISRKQVQELRRMSTFEVPELKRRLSPLADLLREWATNAEYQDSGGHPRLLSMDETDRVSFPSLVRSSIGDLPVGAIRAELLRLGVVSITPDERLALEKRSLIPASVGARLESALVYSLRGLAGTISHNTDPAVSESDRFFERYVESSRMSERQIREIRCDIHARLVRFSEEMDSLLDRETGSENSREARRVGIGIYYSE